MKRKRSLGVTIFGIVHILAGLAVLVLLALVMVQKLSLEDYFELPVTGDKVMMLYGAVGALGALVLALGAGVLALQRWARAGVFLFVWADIAYEAYSMLNAQFSLPLYALVVFWFLNEDEIKAQFFPMAITIDEKVNITAPPHKKELVSPHLIKTVNSIIFWFLVVCTGCYLLLYGPVWLAQKDKLFKEAKDFKKQYQDLQKKETDRVKGTKPAKQKAKKKKDSPFELTGIIYDPWQPNAVVNNVIVKVGDEVGGAKVVEITEISVKLSYQGKDVVLYNR